MENAKKKLNKKSFISNQCVACGVCTQACPLGVISIYKGIRAMVNVEKCIGCGKCAKACPASVIEIRKEEISYGKEFKQKKVV